MGLSSDFTAMPSGSRAKCCQRRQMIWLSRLKAWLSQAVANSSEDLASHCRSAWLSAKSWFHGVQLLHNTTGWQENVKFSENGLKHLFPIYSHLQVHKKGCRGNLFDGIQDQLLPFLKHEMLWKQDAKHLIETGWNKVRSMSKCADAMQLRHNRWRDLPRLGRMSFGHKNPSWCHAPRVDVSHLCNSIPCLTQHETEAKTNCFLCSACTNMGLNIESAKTAFKFSMCFHKNLDLMVSRFHNCERCNLQNGTFWQMQLRYSVCFHIWNCRCKMPSNCPLRLHSVAAFGLRNCICTFASWRFSRDVMSLKLELKTSSLMRTIC